tara:strand:+ start:3725 stop:4732 length:1008 start_codon:yes stop_codon:yes gene_type:complete
MTVSTTNTSSGPFTCNGTTDFFDYTFKVMQAADLVLTLTNTTTGIDTIVSSDDYTATISDTGGRCTFTTAPVTGQTLTITRSTPRTQLTNLENLSAIQPESIEDGLDKLTLIGQDGGSSNAIVVPDSDDSALSKELPTALLRKGKLFGFKATTGEPEVTTGRVTSGSGSGTSIPMGSTPTVTVTYNDSSGNLDLALGLPLGPQGDQGIQGNQGIQGIQGNQGDQGIQGIQGNPGNDGADGIFTQVATIGEAQTGTNNVVGMSPLRVKDAITFNAASVSNAAFYGFKTSGATLQVDVTTALGSEAFTLSDYADSEFASLGLTFSINASGNLIFTTP